MSIGKNIKIGMYDSKCDKDIVILCYKILTSDNLKSNMERVTVKYPISTKVNLTNKMFNPVSWLGQATCNLLVGATAKETCNAWLSMSKEQQVKANNIAKEVIKNWRDKNEDLHG